MNNDYIKKQESPPCTNEPNTIVKEFDKNEITEMKTSNQDINHTEEVIIGTEKGTTFPTTIGTLMYTCSD